MNLDLLRSQVSPPQSFILDFLIVFRDTESCADPRLLHISLLHPCFVPLFTIHVTFPPLSGFTSLLDADTHHQLSLSPIPHSTPIPIPTPTLASQSIIDHPPPTAHPNHHQTKNRSLKLSNTLQASLLKLSAKGISVFSPHTSLDSIEGGINSW